VITVGFNTPYAARMHEVEFQPGPISKQAGNVGTKYIEKHLKADGNELIELGAAIIKKESGG